MSESKDAAGSTTPDAQPSTQTQPGNALPVSLLPLWFLLAFAAVIAYGLLSN